MSNPNLHHLPRLDRQFYRAFAAVHWTMRVEPSAGGWLQDPFHRAFRELLLHACARERLVCPVYCLMPDHLHLIWMGLAIESDQLNAMKFFRLHLNRLLAGEPLEKDRLIDRSAIMEIQIWSLQPQAHDHVLREKERKQNAFARVCFYILANPVRANLVKHEREWPFSGAAVPRYPDLYPLQPEFWELFWKVYFKHREDTPSHAPSLSERC